MISMSKRGNSEVIDSSKVYFFFKKFNILLEKFYVLIDHVDLFVYSCIIFLLV